MGNIKNPTVHVFTSAALNYIPKVRVLVESIKKWHPEWVIHLALSDSIPEGIDLSNEPFDEIHQAEFLDIPDFNGWAFCHNIVELSTAIKPFLLKKLLDRDDCEGVIYLDPDTVVFSRLEEVLLALKHSNVALTPHQLSPETDLAAVIDNEVCSLKHGVYNLGFLAVRPTPIGKAFAAWWAERVYYFCRDEIPNGLFTDQRWIDLAPAFFEGVCILRSPRLNVAPWNLTTRKIDGKAPFKITVDDSPLGFYHFTGFDSGAHRIMAHKNAPGNKTLQSLVDWYGEVTANLLGDSLTQVPWKYGMYSDGAKIPLSARLIYRERLDLQRTFKNPFDATLGYKEWWDSQGKLEYPNFFKSSSERIEISRLQSILTPGYRAGKNDSKIKLGFLTIYLRKALTDSQERRKLIKRFFEIIRTEGMYGLSTRCSSIFLIDRKGKK